MTLCLSELAAVRCNCWPVHRPYLIGNTVFDSAKGLRWCELGRLMQEQSAANSSGE